MDGLERFKQAFHKVFMAELISPKEGETVETTMKRFLDFGSRLESDDEFAEKASHLARLSQRVFEIESSYESLLDAEIYIDGFPFRNTRITRTRYLRYVFENYLNEAYILKDRLKKLLQMLQELYARGTRQREVRKIVGPLFQYNSEAFETLVGIRSTHVHSVRYSDKELRELEYLEGNLRSLLNSSLSSADSLRRCLADLYNRRYAPTRERKAKQLQTLNKGIGRIIDKNFTEIYLVVFDAEGNLYPVERADE